VDWDRTRGEPRFRGAGRRRLLESRLPLYRHAGRCCPAVSGRVGGERLADASDPFTDRKVLSDPTESPERRELG